jgi:O-antigen/teichoic acid export membrane protein
MLGKKILAGGFAALILVKLLFILISPGKWMGAAGVFLGHQAVLWVVYLVLIVVLGYYIFSSLDLIDIALVMFFTSLVVGLSLIPYSSELLKVGGEMAAGGLARQWLPALIWIALAVAVLYRVFSEPRTK